MNDIPPSTPISLRKKNPHIAILMATYNGGEFLQSQLSSIAKQNYKNWSILASDDGSTDDTKKQLEEFSDRGQPLIKLDGPRNGGTENFLSLLGVMGKYLPEDSWVAFSDQDDVWLPDRLSRGVDFLSNLPDDRPALYCSRTLITNRLLQKRRLSPPRPRPPSFENSLVQNIASGNTILLNTSGAKLLRSTRDEVEKVLIHDWWAYQIVSGAGGYVLHDDQPTLLYRQHGGNQIGSNDALSAKANRLAALLRGDFREWIDLNLSSLQAAHHRLTKRNREILDEFSSSRKKSLPQRLSMINRLGLYRQSRSSTAALYISAALRRL